MATHHARNRRQRRTTRLASAGVLLVWTLHSPNVPAAPDPLVLPPPWHWQSISGIGYAYKVDRPVTLRTLATEHQMSARQLMIGNKWPLDTPIPLGSRLWLSDQRIVPGRSGSGGLVNVPEGRFDLFLDGKRMGDWAISVGTRKWPTPLGRFPLQRPVRRPTWFVPARLRAESLHDGLQLPATMPPGPQNPLGEVWLALGNTGVGFHGMPATPGHWPDATGSHGCLRMAPEAVARLADLWRPGLIVDVVYVRAKCLRVQAERFAEVHPDPYALQPTPSSRQLACGVPDAAFRTIWSGACGWPCRWPD